MVDPLLADDDFSLVLMVQVSGQPPGSYQLVRRISSVRSRSFYPHPPGIQELRIRCESFGSVQEVSIMPVHVEI